MTRHKRPDWAKERKQQAIARRKDELARWEAGEFPASYVEAQTLRDQIVERKISRAKAEIAHIEAPVVV